MRVLLTLAFLFLWSCQEKPEVALASPKIQKRGVPDNSFPQCRKDKLGLIQLVCRKMHVVN